MAAYGKVTVLRLKRKISDDRLPKIIVQCPAKKAKIAKTDSFVFELFETDCGGQVNANILGKLEEGQAPHQILTSMQRGNGIDIDCSPSKKQMLGLPPFEQYKITSKSVCQTNEIKNEKNNKKILLEIFDVSKTEKGAYEDEHCENDDDTSEILCNSIKMIRENLNIGEDCAIEDSEFIYDLYYSHANNLDELCDIINIQEFDEDLEYDHDFDKESEADDDSNDENHWKNDYPDEDDFFSSENDDCCSSSSSVDSNHFQYQPRLVDPEFYRDEEESYDFKAYDDYSEDET